MIVRIAQLVVLAVLVTASVAACSSSSSPPGANKALGSVPGGGYLFLRWQDGARGDLALEVMIWHDLDGESTADSAGFASGRLYIERGSARSVDGRSVAWEVQTRDGTTGELQIGGSRYDLEAGNLFLVTTRGGTMAVRQMHRDLAAVPLDHEGILAFARRDPDLAAFLQETPTVTPSPTATAIATAAPAATPAPTATPMSSPTPHPPTPTAIPPSPSPTPSPAPAVERILFETGATQAAIEGYLPDGGRARYVMGVAAGQFVEVNATAGTLGQGLRFSIVGADGVVIKPMGQAHVRAVVPSTQDYYVDLVSDVGATDYQLSVLIPVRIRFAAGATSATVSGSLEEGHVRHYVLRALAGQRMIVAPHATTGQVGLVISGADGQVLLSGRAGPPGGVFEGILPTSQDYLITVQAQGGIGADYSLEITIPAEAGLDITLVGTVLDVSPSARIITLTEPVDGIRIIALTKDSELFSPGGEEILLRDMGAGMSIQAWGRPGEPGALLATQVRILEAQASLFSNLEKDVLGWISARMEKSI
ncbi:MAG: hypothetical protein PVG11_07390 [Anaerolineae bacterium]|jgi:hypothetical protein